MFYVAHVVHLKQRFKHARYRHSGIINVNGFPHAQRLSSVIHSVADLKLKRAQVIS